MFLNYICGFCRVSGSPSFLIWASGLPRHWSPQGQDHHLGPHYDGTTHTHTNIDKYRHLNEKICILQNIKKEKIKINKITKTTTLCTLCKRQDINWSKCSNSGSETSTVWSMWPIIIFKLKGNVHIWHLKAFPDDFSANQNAWTNHWIRNSKYIQYFPSGERTGEYRVVKKLQNINQHHLNWLPSTSTLYLRLSLLSLRPIC